MTPAHIKKFLAVYNNTKKFPDMADVAVALGISHQTVRNRAAIVRKLVADNDNFKMISRARVKVVEKGNEKSPQEHAHARATALATDITAMIQGSRFPLINPECIIVESGMVWGYDRSIGGKVLKESTPRTWLTATPKIAPIKNSRGRKFIFSGAQNDTEVHEGFWKNLKAYAKAVGAEIAIGPGTYETQWWSENNPASRAYDKALKDYLCFGELEIGHNFMFCGQMNILPTASSPITDLVTHSRGRWAVFPHAKRQLRSVTSTDPDIQAHQVMSSGLVTKPKVIPRKAGIKSLFHHVLGAVVVEFDRDGDVFCRHISASKDGSFYDLDVHVTGGKVIRGKHRVTAVTTPDAHRAKMGPVNAKAIWGYDVRTGKVDPRGSLLDLLKPRKVTYHDIFDNETRNHHHAKDPLHNYEQAFRGRDRVITEIEEVADFMVAIRRPDSEDIVVEANHDIALNRYIVEGRFRMDGLNARLGNQLEADLLDRTEVIANCRINYTSAPNWSLLETALRRLKGKALSHVSWAYDGKSYIIGGVEHGHHGFRGANGSKASLVGFAKMGAKISIGDKHAPGIEDGAYGAGALDLNHGYNKGPSGWAVTLIVQQPDNKRQLVTLQNGKIRG